MDREHYPPSTKQSPSIPYRLVSLLPYLLALLYGIFTVSCSKGMATGLDLQGRLGEGIYFPSVTDELSS
ncbi:hypothetical protein HBI23_240530 [Parastagonospora nodorum]|nr:hypothetical protein HBI23_240530 [Parastagonospora nodorum]